MNARFQPTRYLTGVAAKLRSEPARVISTALATLAHWRVQGQSAPDYLDFWEALLHRARQGGAGVEELLGVLEGNDEGSARMRDFHPFPGILTREERRVLRAECAYKH